MGFLNSAYCTILDDYMQLYLYVIQQIHICDKYALTVKYSKEWITGRNTNVKQDLLAVTNNIDQYKIHLKKHFQHIV